MFKKLIYSALISTACTTLYADSIEGKAEDNSELLDSSWCLNVKGVHERQNQYAFGPKNSSAVAFNPIIRFGNVQIESDFYYGRQFTFSGYCKSARNLSKMTGNLPVFFDNFGKLREPSANAMANDVDTAHFYRTYTRATYADSANNYKIVLGDTAVRNTIGFQRVLSGVGISIFRQGGNGSELNGGLPIVITRISKVECKLGDEILHVMVLTPGLYTLNDFPEEAKLPGVTLKISDQLGRSETFKTRYFSGYDMPAAGHDDFDVTLVWDHKWNLTDPHRTKYSSKPHFHTNYRYGCCDDVTLGVGAQVAENGFTIDVLSIFDTPYGKIAPNIAYSNAQKSDTKNAIGAGIYYELPKNDLGLHFECAASVQSKGYTDLDKGEDLQKMYNNFINRYFANVNIAPAGQAPHLIASELLNAGGTPSSTRSVTARIYTDPICGFVPSFVFNGAWSRSQRLREYTLSIHTRLFDCLGVVLSGGLTYDDPSKGRNRQSPDRRLTAAFCWNFNQELSLRTTYSHIDDEKRRTYCCITYTPEDIQGLEVTAERFSRPGVSNPCFAVKYSNEFFEFKIDENITNRYEDKEAMTTNSHSNRQRIYFSTSISPKGISKAKKSSFNVARTI